MTNPYDILGVVRNATDEQIKAAYRELVKKYHPDNYHQSPLKDVAEQKMAQINQAFDQITQERKLSAAQTEFSNSAGYGTGANRSAFMDIRLLIQQNRLDEANALLNGIPTNMRSAEWYFLRGNIYFFRGWLEEAARHFQTAYQMAPQNEEYRAACQRMQWQAQGNFGTGYGHHHTPYHNQTMHRQDGCSGCDICTGLLCLDCCCECMGGDLISCC